MMDVNIEIILILFDERTMGLARFERKDCGGRRCSQESSIRWPPVTQEWNPGSRITWGLRGARGAKGAIVRGVKPSKGGRKEGSKGRSGSALVPTT
jgi:hypothetical protein